MKHKAVKLHDESRCAEVAAFLTDRIYEFNVKATGYADGRLLAGTVQDGAGEIIAGINGYTWGGGAAKSRTSGFTRGTEGRGWEARLSAPPNQRLSGAAASRSYS